METDVPSGDPYRREQSDDVKIILKKDGSPRSKAKYVFRSESVECIIEDRDERLFEATSLVVFSVFTNSKPRVKNRSKVRGLSRSRCMPLSFTTIHPMIIISVWTKNFNRLTI